MEKHSFACLKTLEIEEHLLSEKSCVEGKGENNSCYKNLWELEILFYTVLNLVSQNTQTLIPLWICL